jgi:Protein of unknown function (DUF3098)
MAYKTTSTKSSNAPSTSLMDAFRRKGAPLFGPMNYRLMLLGLILLVVGNLLMIGKEDIYSFTKITLAPLVITSGYLVELAAILYRPRS